MKNIPPNQTGNKWKMSEEGKNKIRLAKLGKQFSCEHRKKLSESHKGIKYPNRKRPPMRTEIHRKKLSDSNKGKKAYWFGRHHTNESKIKMSKIRKGRKLSIETRKKMSLNYQGDKNRFWEGGKNPISMKIRRSLEYRLWREAVFERDNFTCVWCNKKGGYLNADHIQLFSTNPELRFAIDNGRTLCRECHYKRHKKNI